MGEEQLIHCNDTITYKNNMAADGTAWTCAWSLTKCEKYSVTS